MSYNYPDCKSSDMGASRRTLEHSLRRRMRRGRSWPYIYYSILIQPYLDDATVGPQQPGAATMIVQAKSSVKPVHEHDPDDVKKLKCDRYNEVCTRFKAELCHVVFGSNFIENAGAGLEYTTKLCNRTFDSHDQVAAIDESNPQYAELLQDFEQRGMDMKSTVTTVRREIIQHAEAFDWAIYQIVHKNKKWSEHIVKNIHAILYGEMGNDEVTPGEYRPKDHRVAVRYLDPKTGKEKVTVFIHPEAVPGYMTAWVENLNRDMKKADEGHPIDPYDLAAKHYHQFINIHPFADGNGRVSRIILNVLVLKFAGHFIRLGETEAEKKEFLEIAQRGAQMYRKEDGEVELDEQKGHREMAKLMIRKSTASLKEIWGV